MLISVFDKDFSIRGMDESHVQSLAKALKSGDSLPLPKVARVGSKLVVLSGNHILTAMMRLNIPLRFQDLGEMDYLSAIRVVLKDNPHGYKPPTYKELQLFLSRAYTNARHLGISRQDFIHAVSEATSKSQSSIYRMLKDVFKSEDEHIKHTAINLLLSGKPLKVVADILGVSVSSIQRWRKAPSVSLPPLRLFQEETILTQEFLSKVSQYLSTIPHASLDGLFLWLCNFYAIDPLEWKSFTSQIRALLPQEILDALGVGEKQLFQLKSAKESPQAKKPRRITLRGVRSELSRINKSLKNLILSLSPEVAKELSGILQSLNDLEQKVSSSITSQTSKEINLLSQELLSILDRAHQVKTGYKLINQYNAGKYFLLIRKIVLMLLKNHSPDRVKDVFMLLIATNLFIYGDEWYEFLKGANERLDWLKHRFSLSQNVWSKVLRREITKDMLLSLTEQLQNSISNSSSLSEKPVLAS